MALPEIDVDRLITDLLAVPPAIRDRWLTDRIPTDPSLRDQLRTAIGDSTVLSSEQRRRLVTSVRGPIRSPDPVPATIGRYEVIRAIGEGGMGRVLLARDPNVGRLVAIKQVRGDFESDDSRKRFWREARAAGRLRHPNIVTIYDVDELDGEPFMVMEYVPGRTLADLIARREAGTLERRLELIESLCAGLAAAHAASVVHRDVKPSNVMVDEHGVLKILDFGIARPTPLDTDVTTTTLTAGHAILGTVGYIAPECFLGSQADFRCDMFAAAVVAYELLTYDRPFGNVPTMMSRRALVGDITPMRVAAVGVPAEVERLVLRGLAVSPTDRFRDMTTMAARFAEARRDAATTTDRPDDLETPGAGWSATHRAIAGAVGVAVLVLGGVLTLRTWPAAPEQEPVRPETEMAATDTAPASRPEPPPSRPKGSTGGTRAIPSSAAAAPMTKGAPPSSAPVEPPPVNDTASSTLPSSPPASPAPAPPIESATSSGGPESASGTPPDRDDSGTAAVLSGDDLAAIRGTLRTYEDAFEQRSTPELRRVHPTMTASELAIFERRFLDSQTYKVTLSDERVTPESPTLVTVQCRIAREVVPVRGTPRRQAGRAAITLSKDAGAWVIAAVRAPDWW